MAVAAAADDGAGQAAEERQEEGFGQELLGDVAAGGAQGAAQADLGAAFEDGDDHDVGDADAADEQGDGAQAEEQAVVGAFGGDLGLQDVGGVGDVHGRRGLAGLTVAGSTAATALTWLGSVRTIQLGGVAVEARSTARRSGKPMNAMLSIWVTQRDVAQDADHGEPVPADPHLGGVGQVVDAEQAGRLGAQDDRRVAGGGRVEEGAVGHAGAQGGGQGRVGGGQRDAVGVDGGDEGGAVHVGAGDGWRSR